MARQRRAHVFQFNLFVCAISIFYIPHNRVYYHSAAPRKSEEIFYSILLNVWRLWHAFCSSPIQKFVWVFFARIAFKTFNSINYNEINRPELVFISDYSYGDRKCLNFLVETSSCFARALLLSL